MDAKLSVWTAYYVDLSPEDAVLELKKNGVTCSELSDEHGLELLQRGDPKIVGAAFRAFLDEQNFTMTQGHLWLKVKICTDPDALPILHKWLELYEAIGIRNAVLHVDGFSGHAGMTVQEKLDRNLEALKKIQSKMDGMKIRICLENLRSLCGNSDQLLYLIDRLEPGRFGICLDTGHLNLAEQPQEEFIRAAGKRLTALHVADNEGERDQHMMPFGRGNVDFEKIVRALREVDYHGLFNLEIPGERMAPLPVRGYKLEYIRKCYDYLMQIP